MKLFSLNSNPEIAQKIADHAGVPLGKISSRQFSDGEIQVNIEESVRGYDIYIIQSTSFPVNNHLMELLIMVDACQRASANTVNVVMPYFGYARQDRTAALANQLLLSLSQICWSKLGWIVSSHWISMQCKSKVSSILP